MVAGEIAPGPCGASARVTMRPGWLKASSTSRKSCWASCEGSARPGAISPAATAYLLTLADRDTPLWLAPAFNTPEVRDYLRFHTGAPIVEDRAAATFAVLPYDDADPFEGFAIGTDTYPDRSATLLIEVPALGAGPVRTGRGPGIKGETQFAIAGLDDWFWRQCATNHALFPCGVDLVLAAGSQLLALPRSISVEVSPCTSR